MIEDATIFAGIWERRYFANNGPLVQQLDATVAAAIGVKYAIAVVSGFAACMLTARALARGGEIIVPAVGAGRLADAIRWAGAVPVFCDVDADGNLAVTQISRVRSAATTTIAAVRRCGVALDAPALDAAAQAAGETLIIDAGETIGGSRNGRRFGAFGHAETADLSGLAPIDAAGGGIITTNDDTLVAQLRTMRSFHANETFVPYAMRMNAKMSEAQAALALADLDRLDARLEAIRTQRYIALEAFEKSAHHAFCGNNGDDDGAAVEICCTGSEHPARALAERLREQGCTVRTYGEALDGFPAAAEYVRTHLTIVLDAHDMPGDTFAVRLGRALA